MISTANAYVADVTPPEKRAQGFGMTGAAFGLGFIIGPLFGGVLGNIDLRLPFWAAAGCSAANWLYGFFVLPESLAPENRRAFSWKRANPIGALMALKRFPAVLGLAEAYFILTLGQVMVGSAPSSAVATAPQPLSRRLARLNLGAGMGTGTEMKIQGKLDLKFGSSARSRKSFFRGGHVERKIASFGPFSCAGRRLEIASSKRRRAATKFAVGESQGDLLQLGA